MRTLIGGNMRLPDGTLKHFASVTGLSRQYLSDIINTRKRPGRNRAVFLEQATINMGIRITAAQWMFSDSDTLKKLLCEMQ